MSEFSMMTQGISWPLAYGAFIAFTGIIGCGTYALLRYFEGRSSRPRAAVEEPTC
jgi:magnesium transporter